MAQSSTVTPTYTLVWTRSADALKNGEYLFVGLLVYCAEKKPVLRVLRSLTCSPEEAPILVPAMLYTGVHSPRFSQEQTLALIFPLTAILYPSSRFVVS